MRIVQNLTRILALGIFIFLFLANKPGIWNFVIVGALIVALFWGRLYCGWVCPIRTAMIPFQWLHQKFIPEKQSIKFLNGAIIRYVIFVLFIVIFVLNKLQIWQVPPIILLAAAAFIAALMWGEEVWHGNICPIGTLLSFTAMPARWGMVPDISKCVYCGKCTEACPAAAVTLDREQKNIQIKKTSCLQCFDCSRSCPKEALGYRSSRVSPESDQPPVCPTHRSC